MQEGLDAFQLPRNELRWNSSTEWVADELADEAPVITFLRGGAPVLKLEVTKPLLNLLMDLMKEDPAGQRKLIQTNARFQNFIDLLLKRQIILDSALQKVHVRIFSDIQTEITSWDLSAERPLTIDILVGDEYSLVSRYPEFLKSRSEGTLVSFVKISADQIETGPIRFAYEASTPTTRASVASRYPSWPVRFQRASESLKELLQEALSSSLWYVLTIHGFRLAWKWEESRTPYRVQTSPVSQPKDCVALFQYKAQVENEEPSGGSGETAADAEFSARCEAWERFCLSRSDLAAGVDSSMQLTTRLEDLDGKPGICFDYLRKLTAPLHRAPKWCRGWSLTSDKQYRVPTEWIYFDHHSGVVNTNGAAFGSTVEDAVESAKLELIERHLLIKTYLGLGAGKEISLSNLGTGVALMAPILETKRRRARWYHLGECNKSHAVLCLVSSDIPPFVSVGSAARASIHDAARKALSEALITDYLWSRKIEQLGADQFVRLGPEILKRPGHTIGFEESAWVWAAMPEGEARLHSIFNSGEPWSDRLTEENFIGIDIGKNILSSGSVVKVLHPDSLPLPSFYKHALSLFEQLKIPPPLPIPIN